MLLPILRDTLPTSVLVQHQEHYDIDTTTSLICNSDFHYATIFEVVDICGTARPLREDGRPACASAVGIRNSGVCTRDRSRHTMCCSFALKQSQRVREPSLQLSPPLQDPLDTTERARWRPYSAFRRAPPEAAAGHSIQWRWYHQPSVRQGTWCDHSRPGRALCCRGR